MIQHQPTQRHHSDSSLSLILFLYVNFLSCKGGMKLVSTMQPAFSKPVCYNIDPFHKALLVNHESFWGMLSMVLLPLELSDCLHRHGKSDASGGS